MMHTHGPTETVESLRVLKRRIYLWALLAGVLALLVGWIPKFFSGMLTVYEQIIFPRCDGSLSSFAGRLVANGAGVGLGGMVAIFDHSHQPVE